MNRFRVIKMKDIAMVNIFRVEVTSTVVLLPAYLMHPGGQGGLGWGSVTKPLNPCDQILDRWAQSE